tara:strand:+ start:10847 stop:12967 length:2121 start_codon:yes stop_codon:yes gene_type:complete
MKKYLIGLLFFLFASNLNAFSITIYISPSGSDTNQGTIEKPVASLEAACLLARNMRKSGALSEPVEVIIETGTYVLGKPFFLTPEDSGTEDSPLVFKGNREDQPVFSGGISLPDFEKVSDSLWKIEVSEIKNFGGNIQQLFVNGERAVRARTPNAYEYFKTKSASQTLIGSGERNWSRFGVHKIGLTADQLEALKDIPYPEFEDMIVSIHHAWDRTRKYVQRFSMQDSSIYILGRPMHRWNTLDNSSQFYLENAKSFLDAPGEWFLEQDGTLYYMPKEGQTIENSTAVVPVLDNLVIIKGDKANKVQNIRFENLSFQYTRFMMGRQGNEPSQAASTTEAAVMADYADNIWFKNCEIAHTGTNAIWLRAACADSKVEHCYFHDLGIGGVKIGEKRAPAGKNLITRNITVDNNIMRSAGSEFPTGVGVVIFASSDNTISHNEIADFGYSGVSVGWIWGYKESAAARNKIIYNHIHHLGWGALSDMGGVYTLGPSEGTVVSNNVIHDVYSYGYGGWGLYTDEGSTGIVMENNLVYKCKSSGFHQHYGKENIIRNNIFASQWKGQLEATRVEDHLSFTFTNNIIYFDRGILIGKPGWEEIKIAADNNCYWDTRTENILFREMEMKEWKKTTGKDIHSIIADPGFVNPEECDYTIKNKAVISKIDFKPFDYSKAGVYGDESWVELATFDPAIAKRFDWMVEKREKETTETH